MVWILSSTVLIVSNMLGYILVSREESRLMVAILVPGLFLMVSCLLFIIWSYKKEIKE